MIHELNGRLLERLSTSAARKSAVHPAHEVVVENRQLWVALDASARKRASLCPFLLIDFRFQDGNWWQWAREQRTGRVRASGHPSLLPRAPAVEVAHDALLIAWHAARLNNRVAGQLLAMSSMVSDTLAGLGLGQVRQIATHHYREMCPRLEQPSSFWRKLLAAAYDNDREALFDLHLHGFQMLHADLRLPPSPASSRSPASRSR